MFTNIEFIINRLKEAFNVKTQKDLAEKLEIGVSTISMWKNRGSVDYDLIFTKCEGVNLDWLIKGEGEMYKTDVKKGTPLYDLPVSAGDHFNISGDLNAIKGYIEIPGVKCKAYFPIVGSSMEPLVESGNWIGVNQIDIVNDNPIINPTKIFFIITSDERMIKNIEYHQNDDHITCISPNYSPFKVPLNDIKALYRVDVVIKFP